MAATVKQTDDETQNEEDAHAGAVATYIVLLAAHARGLVGYWRTPGVLRTPEGRAALEIPDDERVLGLIYLGHPCQDKQPPERAPSDEYVTFLS